MSLPRNLQVQVLLNVLLFLGGAGAAVGGWAGYTYLFEPLDAPPEVVKAAVTVNTRKAKESDDVILSADLDRVGRCSFEVFYKGGGSVLVGPSPTVASSFQVVASRPGSGSWYDLAPGFLPAWIERIVVRTYKVGWDTTKPLAERKHKETVIHGK